MRVHTEKLRNSGNPPLGAFRDVGPWQRKLHQEPKNDFFSNIDTEK